MLGKCSIKPQVLFLRLWSVLTKSFQHYLSVTISSKTCLRNWGNVLTKIIQFQGVRLTSQIFLRLSCFSILGFSHTIPSVYDGISQYQLESFLIFSGLVIGQTVTQAIQCYACGLPNIQPDNDIRWASLAHLEWASFSFVWSLLKQQYNIMINKCEEWSIL